MWRGRIWAPRWPLCDLAGLPTGEALVEALAATQRLVSWAQARQAELVAEVARRVPEVIGAAGCSGYEVAEFEVGAALRLSSRAAQARVDGCLAIAERPAVLEALREGRIDWVRAEAIASAVGALAFRAGMAGAADLVEADALGRAPGQTAPQLRARLARLVLKADPAGADARLAAARRERRVWVSPLEDGMAELRALLTAPDALRVYAALGEAGWAARCAERDTRREAAGARRRARGAAPGRGAAADAGPVPRRRPGADRVQGAGHIRRGRSRSCPRGRRWCCRGWGGVWAGRSGRTGGGSRRGWGGCSPRRGPPPGSPNGVRSAPADPRDGPRRDAAGPGRGARPPRRLRPDPRQHGPRTRPGRHLAAGS